MTKKTDTPQKRYNDKRVQVCQIKVTEGSEDQREIGEAIDKIQKTYKYGSIRDLFVDSVKRRAKRIK